MDFPGYTPWTAPAWFPSNVLDSIHGLPAHPPMTCGSCLTPWSGEQARLLTLTNSKLAAYKTKENHVYVWTCINCETGTGTSQYFEKIQKLTAETAKGIGKLRVMAKSINGLISELEKTILLVSPHFGQYATGSTLASIRDSLKILSNWKWMQQSKNLNSLTAQYHRFWLNCDQKNPNSRFRQPIAGPKTIWFTKTEIRTNPLFNIVPEVVPEANPQQKLNTSSAILFDESSLQSFPKLPFFHRLEIGPCFSSSSATVQSSSSSSASACSSSSSSSSTTLSFSSSSIWSSTNSNSISNLIQSDSNAIFWEKTRTQTHAIKEEIKTRKQRIDESILLEGLPVLLLPSQVKEMENAEKRKRKNPSECSEPPPTQRQKCSDKDEINWTLNLHDKEISLRKGLSFRKKLKTCESFLDHWTCDLKLSSGEIATLKDLVQKETTRETYHRQLPLYLQELQSEKRNKVYQILNLVLTKQNPNYFQISDVKVIEGRIRLNMEQKSLAYVKKLSQFLGVNVVNRRCLNFWLVQTWDANQWAIFESSSLIQELQKERNITNNECPDEKKKIGFHSRVEKFYGELLTSSGIKYAVVQNSGFHALTLVDVEHFCNLAELYRGNKQQKF